MLYAGSLPQAQVYSSSALFPFHCRTLDSITDYSVDPGKVALSEYVGGKAINCPLNTDLTDLAAGLMRPYFNLH